MKEIDVYKYLHKKILQCFGRSFKMSEMKYKDYIIYTFFVINGVSKDEADNKMKIKTYIVNEKNKIVGTKFEIKYDIDELTPEILDLIVDTYIPSIMNQKLEETKMLVFQDNLKNIEKDFQK